MPGLIFRPVLQLGESVGSFFLRASEGNGYGSIKEMLVAHKSGNYYVPLFSNLTIINWVVEILGLSGEFSEAILNRTNRSGVVYILHNEHLIPQGVFREDCSAFCPICVVEKPYWRKLWQLRPYSVCHVHSVAMQIGCYKCNNSLNFSRERLLYCDCGADLRQAPIIPEDLMPVQWLCALLNGTEDVILDDFFQFWLALAKIDGYDFSAFKELWRLRVAIAWYYKNSVAIDEIKKLVLDKGRHPRVVLRSFLCAGNTLKEYAGQILSELSGASLIKTIECHDSDNDVEVGRFEASAILGVGRKQLDDLISEGVLNTVVHGGEFLHFKLSALEKLLLEFQGKSNEDEFIGFINFRGSLIERVKLVLNEDASLLGYTLAAGLQSLEVRVKSPKSQLEDSDVMSLENVALLLNVHIEVVRSLINSNWINYVLMKHKNSKKMMLSAASVEIFNKYYQSAGSLARSIGINPTNCAEKLVCLGARPIAGPRIDGVLVYFFCRLDLEKINYSELIDLKEYKTKAGRPRKDTVCQPIDGVSLQDCARFLGISKQAVAALIHKGVLRKDDSKYRDILVSERSLSALAEIIFSPTYIEVDDAAELLGYSLDQFEVYFVETGVVKVINLHVWRLIHEHDLLYPKKLAADYFSASQAGMLFGMHRSFFPNLESRLGIKPLYVGEGKRRVKFYSKEDVALVAREYRLIPISSRTKFN